VALRGRKLLALMSAVAALGLVAGCGDDDEDSGGGDGGTAAESTPAEGGGGTIKVGFLSDCEGAFGSFFEPTASGFNLALIRHAGGKPAGEKPTDGVTGAKIGDTNIEVVGYGCADDTADKAIEETRRLMEQEDADVLVGPLSGDEGIAVANYAKEHPDKTFVNGISGAQDTTLKVQAPNFFRFHPDGAQWSAGLGDYAYNELGWKKAAIVGDDYSFPYTSLAGFVAEYCAVGGDITKRVWAPLGEEDYSSYISQIPEDIDGLYVGIGGSGLINFLKQYKEQRGDIDTEKMMGNVFWDDPLVLKEVGKDLVGGVTSAMTAADDTSPEVASYIEDLKTHYGDEIAGAGPSVFTYGYYTGATALVKALQEVNGDVSDQAPLQEALTATTLSGDEAPWGDVKLDDNRQAISNVFLKKIVADKTGDGVPDVQTLSRIPEVDQTFGGVFSADTPAPDRENPKCEKGTPPPWVGNAEPVNFGQ
jgi:branched-chain amino acid transport system substrate-binding protein